MTSHDLFVNWTNPDDFVAANPKFDPWTLELEKQLLFGEPNLDELANKYTSYFHRDGIVRMLQDIDKQGLFYANLLEELKKPVPMSDTTIPVVMMPNPDYFRGILRHYEAIGAIPNNALPPETSVGAGLVDWTQSTVKWIIEKLEKLARRPTSRRAVRRGISRLAASAR
jgi:hypothetical protein